MRDDREAWAYDAAAGNAYCATWKTPCAPTSIRSVCFEIKKQTNKLSFFGCTFGFVLRSLEHDWKYCT